MPLTPKAYAVALIATAFALFGAVVAANVLIDPQGMFGTGLFPHKLNTNDRYLRYIDYRKSEAKVEGLMFASSRGAGIPLDVLSAHTGVAYADFTVRAGMITDHLPVLERAIRDKAASGARLKDVFLLLDVDLIGSRPSTNRNPQTQLHPDLTGEDPKRFWIRYFTAIQFYAWRDDVRRALAPKGARTTGGDTDSEPAARVRYAALGAPPPPPSKPPIRVIPRHDYQRQLALVGRFVALCRDNGIRLTIALSPLRNSTADLYDRADLAAAAADLARIAPVWDFGSPPWLSERPDLWIDASHFASEVGAMMIRRIHTGTLPPGGEPFGALRSP